MFQKKRGNSTDRKEYNSKWSNNIFNIDKVEYEITGNKTYKVAGINKPLLRHEILLVND